MDDIRPAVASTSTRFIDCLRRDVRTTEIYTHVLGRGAMGVISPIDS